MADFKTPNLCGANPELNNVLSKLDDLKNEIASKLDSTASEAAAAFETGLANVKAGLDGLAIDLPEIPDVNFQSELTGLINDIDKTTIQGLATFNSKLAQLELDFGDTLKEKGLTLDSLITDATTKLSSGGNLCDLAPNIEIPAGSSGTGVTIEEIEERVSNAATITLTQTPKEILSVTGKKTTQSFFTNIQYNQNGKTIVPKATGTYSDIKVKYTISLIKEKPVEAKQADTSPEAEEFSSVTVNTSVIEVRESLKTKQQDIDTGEIFSKPDETGFVKKADPVKDVEPVVTKTGGTISATTPAKSNVVTTETITTTTGGGYTQTFSAPVTKRKVQSDKGFTTRKKRRYEYFVLKGSINEAFWSAPGIRFNKTKNVKKHKVIDDVSNITLKYVWDDIIHMSVYVEPKAIDPTAKELIGYYGRRRSGGYKLLDYHVNRKTKGSMKKNEIDWEIPYLQDQKFVEIVDYESGQPLTEGTRVRITYIHLEKVDPNFSG